MNRRLFLSTAPAMLGAARISAADSHSQAPTVTRPRATAGDEIEPDWEQRIKINGGSGEGRYHGFRSPCDPGGGRLCHWAWRRNGPCPARYISLPECSAIAIRRSDRR